MMFFTQNSQWSVKAALDDLQRLIIIKNTRTVSTSTDNDQPLSSPVITVISEVNQAMMSTLSTVVLPANDQTIENPSLSLHIQLHAHCLMNPVMNHTYVRVPLQCQSPQSSL